MNVVENSPCGGKKYYKDLGFNSDDYPLTCGGEETCGGVLFGLWLILMV